MALGSVGTSCLPHSLYRVVVLLAALSVATSCAEAERPKVLGNPAQETAKRLLREKTTRTIAAHQQQANAAKRVEDLSRHTTHPGLSPKEQAQYQSDLDQATAELQASTERVDAAERELAQVSADYRRLYEGDAVSPSRECSKDHTSEC